MSTHLAYFWWTPLHEKQEIHEKTWCWCQHHIFSCISCFSRRGVHQKYAKWVIVGCEIEFPIQLMLPIKIWVKPHGDKLKIRVEKVLYFFFSSKIWWGKLILFYFFHYYFINSLRRPILDLKIPLMMDRLCVARTHRRIQRRDDPNIMSFKGHLLLL